MVMEMLISLFMRGLVVVRMVPVATDKPPVKLASRNRLETITEEGDRENDGNKEEDKESED